MPKNSKGKEVAEVKPKKCTGCQACIAECPVDAITIVDGIAQIDAEKCIGCGKCFNVCPADAIIFDKPVKKKAVKKEDAETAEKLKEYEGVAVYIEVHNGIAADVSWELVGKGRELADKLKTKVIGFLISPETKKIAKEAIAYGCDEVYVIENEVFAEYKSKLFGETATELCNSVKPEIFLIGASPLGRDLASVIATHLRTGLTADCTGLDIVSGERNLMMTRPTFGGNIMATILCKNHRPQMSTVRPKVMKMPEKDAKRKGQIIPYEYKPAVEEFPRIIKKIPAETEGVVDITQAPVLIVVGKGACESKYFEMIEELSLIHI